MTCGKEHILERFCVVLSIQRRGLTCVRASQSWRVDQGTNHSHRRLYRRV